MADVAELQAEVDRRKKELIANPAGHRHDFAGLTACCMVGGILSAELMDAHETYAPVGRNGGRTCDTTEGPCSCGAWH